MTRAEITSEVGEDRTIGFGFDAIVFALTKGIWKLPQAKADNTVRYNLQFEQEP